MTAATQPTISSPAHGRRPTERGAGPPAPRERRPARPGRLDEFQLYQPAAGHPDWPRLADQAKRRAGELRSKLVRPRRDRAHYARVAKSYRTLVENFGKNLRLSRAGREDLRPLYFIWTLLRACNFRCEYCDDHRGRKYPDLPDEGVLGTDQALELLRIMRTGTSSVYFSGGEPTMRQDLPEITREAHRLGYYPIIINTNGSLLHRWLERDHWRGWLADMDIVIVSLDALDLDLLGRMWVYRKSEEVLLNLLLLRELRQEMDFKLMVNTVIQPGHTDEAKAVLDLCNDLGIWFCPVPMNVGPRVASSIVADEGYRRLAELIIERKRAGYRISGSPRMLRRLLFGEPLRCRNTLKPHIDFDGRLIWPCKSTQNVEPEQIDVLQFETVDALYDHACTKVDPTRFHGPANNQCGASCNWAQNYSTDAYVHGLDKPWSLLSDIRQFLEH
ncbi:MAG: radical SAM protein [Deltaproteobacteria bacterium]|jgi:MoaA/NifB/PqqE/SkfB family radical SAM enzyme|nr:radical SAM protein [Deltaproteobacteria bacterium]MBW2532625.1 radical SAM protein [Deltaproteobacteria bacterium]